MYIKEFDYYLPQDRIAQEPEAKRDESKLLVVNRQEKSCSERIFKEIKVYFNPGDVLVLNNTKVLPVRLFAERITGAKIELLLLEETGLAKWKSLVKPSKRIKESESLIFPETGFQARVLRELGKGVWELEFEPKNVKTLMDKKGIMPTPPYIKKRLTQEQQYQTVYAEKEGSIACPTAGLHFTQSLIKELKDQRVKVVYVTLHVGLGTFKAIEAEFVKEHIMDREYCQISPQTAEDINRAKLKGCKVWACGTSSVRTLETYAYFDKEKGVNQVKSGFKKTDLFIYPGYKIKIVDRLITNFHLPRSTNLLLAASFLGKDFLLRSYRYAIENNFRFYSFGDAMAVL
jgi:S-adenosylmethionine:tRNA ribosyltransferase-isomerase